MIDLQGRMLLPGLINIHIHVQGEVPSALHGRLADLLVLDGDAVEDPELLLDPERIWLVLQLGEPVAGSHLRMNG